MGKAWQRQIRERKAVEAAGENLFGNWWESLDVSMDKAELREVDYSTAAAVIDEYEWLGKMSSNFCRAYGIFWDGNCGGVVVYGSTVNNTQFAKSICELKYSDSLMQLQRGACVHWAHPHAASRLIGYSLRQEERRGTRIVIAFSDPEAGEIGTVYQATNWLYCGETVVRPDYINPRGERMAAKSGNWARDKQYMTRTTRPLKRRYLYILGSKKERREIRGKLLWKPQDYPKRQSSEANTVSYTEARFDSALPLQT